MVALHCLFVCKSFLHFFAGTEKKFQNDHEMYKQTSKQTKVLQKLKKREKKISEFVHLEVDIAQFN